jgi:Rps23 Pro-64 3,4-dihydroxylase Tpa1-like proline 4-hydroxylase
MDGQRLLDLNPALDVASLAATFARDRRLQIRNVLTEASAHIVHRILAEETPWGLAWQAGSQGPERLRQAEVAALAGPDWQKRSQASMASMRWGDYAFAYASYSMVDGYVEKWEPGGPHDLLLEYLNDKPVMDLVRTISGIPELVKVDAQATLYGPNHFLAVHNDKHANAGRRVAYVLNMCAETWRPDWGGYLNFYDDDGDVIAGFRPRFNALNLFSVPQRHNVSFVPPFAATGRYAITGWFLDR